ncbi:DEAD/DEAH box helicase [Apiospora rasikravindrae]|uniref:DEAD/DEAH box helicase n=1 Tax=Apiospora rasikravindrae TaxID=990691 RepID=A0ABR1RM88_9PEZI
MAVPLDSRASGDDDLVAAWFDSLSPLKVDIVGDFVGKELFAIVGEALLVHCILQEQVDFQGASIAHVMGYHQFPQSTDSREPVGFQVLHAVHAVELTLSRMKERGCNFHILWFDSYRDLCVPPMGSDEVASKAPLSFQFMSTKCDKFEAHRKDNPLQFVMCSNGRVAGAGRSVSSVGCRMHLHQSLGYRMASLGYRVAFLDDIEIRSSKVFTSVVNPHRDLKPLGDEQALKRQEISMESDIVAAVPEINTGRELSTREIISIYSLGNILLSLPEVTGVAMELAAVLLIQLTILRYREISRRALPELKLDLGTQHHDIMTKFYQTACITLENWDTNKWPSTKWDAFDFFDGRVFAHALQCSYTLDLSSQIYQEVQLLARVLYRLSGVDVSLYIHGQPRAHRQASVSAALQSSLCSRRLITSSAPDVATSGDQLGHVLPFSHPVLDQHLSNVVLVTRDEIEQPARVFSDLTHWHNHTKPIDPKHIPRAPDRWTLKRNQRHMANVIAYSASLTGASGKIINPEIIVVSKTTSSVAKEALNAGGKAKQKPKSGKDRALEAAAALKKEKIHLKNQNVNSFWKTRCIEFQKERSLAKRYLAVGKFLSGLSPEQLNLVGSEVLLFLCSLLVEMQGSKGIPSLHRSNILGMLWSRLGELQRLPVTAAVAEQVAGLSHALQTPMSNLDSSLSKRGLPFPFSSKEVRLPDPKRARQFQLNFCGPFMDRSFDSSPDPRVPFQPDAWQKRVLDAIDQNKSLFVVAPTSAGKTFISFYAMKRVLQTNDDDVIVYVAPTKALVNQIAAEVQARFSKSYRHDGRGVWAIHTRDYRINNPQGCQILVTVPHILQVMLLSASNAKTPKSWARRVKRIIFDEVHCIGQSEDGIVWEQLLLLAPCPVIALSATVGNPLEFKEWLEGTQQAKGFELEMITHSSRYSDLRKFIYHGSDSEFSGFQPVDNLPLPGLDSSYGKSDNFTFIHPIGAMSGRNADTLNDLSLEPRDCLALWNCMNKHQTDKFFVDPSLDPTRFLPRVLKKSDVVKWDRALRDQLESWMNEPDSPFDKVRLELLGDRYKQISTVPTSEDEQSPGQNTTNDSSNQLNSVFFLIQDLRSCDALPAIIFNYDRVRCENILEAILIKLHSAEDEYRSGPVWVKKMADFQKWKRVQEKSKAIQNKTKQSKAASKGTDEAGNGATKHGLLREKIDYEPSHWTSFDPDAPIAEFTLADHTKISRDELEKSLRDLQWLKISTRLISALKRGVGVHHAGMNRRYRQIVEMLFRKGYLTVVIGTGTLALGINMPCKTVVFTGDSVFLTALNYHQGSGRAGRRGFDVLGNVVFHGLAPHRALEVMSAKLPDLRGQFPTSVTLILRLFQLLHGTENCKYATNAVHSLLTQTRLYLGGPKAQMSIYHHLRFSIDYLRRQQLISEKGVPLNFSGLIGHLYFTENAVFALHCLLKEGYFHQLCSDMSKSASRQKDVMEEIVLVLAHLFCRLPCDKYENQAWLRDIVRPSASVVLLPDLPESAARMLEKHNAETLRIFKNYVATYVSQHLAEVPDNRLPLTKLEVNPSFHPCSVADALPWLDEPKIRSPFASLSGLTDDFATIGELCGTVRDGVFLDDSGIPYIPVSPHETGGVPWNAYLYDFFKHGDYEALVRANGIRRGDVWFRLKDFSLILATITTSLANFINHADSDDAEAMLDVCDAGDNLEEFGAEEIPTGEWGELLEEQSEDAGEPERPTWAADGTLANVYRVFEMVRLEFDKKFVKVWT